MTLRLFAALLGTALLAAPTAAPAADPATPADPATSADADDLYSVKISLSEDDPDVQSQETDADLLDFYLFVDGAPTRGAEFGVTIEGGTLVAYVIDTKNAWVTLPLEDPYPGTIAQVKAGPDCFEPPVYFGRLMVRPDSPGGKVELNVIPSVRAAQTAVIHCDQSGSFEVMAHHAAANGKPRAAERLASTPQQPTPEAVDDHAGHDHGAHGG
ncbi:MAG TPA: hypothetical protein VKU85_00895 [bacterium]|nr:hypothetical protein [bacterium]